MKICEYRNLRTIRFNLLIILELYDLTILRATSKNLQCRVDYYIEFFLLRVDLSAFQRTPNFLTKCENIRNLTLRQRDLDNELVHIICNSTKLKTLNLIECDLDYKMLRKVADNCVETLETLDIEYIFQNIENLNIIQCEYISDASLKFVAQHLNRLKGLTVGGEECELITDEDICELVKFCVKLEKLELFYLRYVGRTSICIGLHLPMLKKLVIDVGDFSLSDVKDEDITRIANNCQFLEHFEITQCEDVSDCAVKSFGKLTQLRVCSFDGWRAITDQGIEYLSKMLPLLEEVNLGFTEGLTHNALFSIGPNCPRLRRLNINYSEIKEEHLCDFFTAYTLLETVIAFHSTHVSDVTVKCIAKNLKNLKILDVAEMSAISDESICDVAEKCSKLEGITFGSELITDKSIYCLVKNATRLSHIDIYNVPNVSRQAKNCTEENY